MPRKIKKKKPLLRLTAPGEIRMSEVIAEFAEPLLKQAHDEKTHEIAILMAVACWNLSLMPEDQHEKEIMDLLPKISTSERDKKDAEDIVRLFLDRKRTLFLHIIKLVVSHDVQFINGQMRLNVVSTYAR